MKEGGEKAGSGKKRKVYWYTVSGLLSVSLILNLVARLSRTFSDWYRSHIFPFFYLTIGRLNGLVPFSVGEILILFLMIASVLTIVLILACLLTIRSKKSGTSSVRHERTRKVHSVLLTILRKWCSMILMGASVIFLVVTGSDTMLYQCSPLDPNPLTEEKNYTIEDLYCMREYLISKAEELYPLMERDKDGYVICENGWQKACIQAMKALAEREGNQDGYSSLGGFYTGVKPFIHSDFISRMGYGGFYLPYSAEANYNANLYIVQQTKTICHELAHIKGYMRESEANFIAFRALIESDSAFLQYCACLTVLTYVEKDFIMAGGYETYDAVHFKTLRIKSDTISYIPEVRERFMAGGIIPSKELSQIADKVNDTGLKLNGVSSGMDNYSEVVDLLLQYYDGKLSIPAVGNGPDKEVQ